MATHLVNDKHLEGLTNQRRMFCFHWAASENYDQVEAARKAGYKNPHQASNKLVKVPAIRRFMQKIQKQREYRTQLSADKIWAKLYRIIFFDPASVYSSNGDGWWHIRKLEDIPEEVRCMIKEVKCTKVRMGFGEDARDVPMLEVKFMDKDNALALACRHGLPTEHHHKGLIGAINLSDKEVVPLTREFYDRMCEMPKDPDPIEQLLEGPDK